MSHIKISNEKGAAKAAPVEVHGDDIYLRFFSFRAKLCPIWQLLTSTGSTIDAYVLLNPGGRMLQAILSSKAGRIGLEGESVSWREAFQRSEDLLTATFFGRVPYLSDGALSALLGFMVGRPVELSGFEELELWPYLENSSGNKVEPDVVLHFEQELFVIEVKPPFGGTQSRMQWLNQIEAVKRNEAYAEYEKIYFIALGNVGPEALEQSALPVRFEPMAACEWEPLRHWLRQNAHFSTRQDKAILRDWQNAFELYGMAPMIPSWQPMVDMTRSIDLAAGLEQLQHWR